MAGRLYHPLYMGTLFVTNLVRHTSLSKGDTGLIANFGHEFQRCLRPGTIKEPRGTGEVSTERCAASVAAFTIGFNSSVTDQKNDDKDIA